MVDVVSAIHDAIETDCCNESEKLIAFYEMCNHKEKSIIDYVSMFLCGWTFRTIMEKAKIGDDEYEQK